MSKLFEKGRKELAGLRAAITACQQLETSKGRAFYLVDHLKTRPSLEKYLRACYDGERLYPFHSTQASGMSIQQKRIHKETTVSLLLKKIENEENEERAAEMWLEYTSWLTDDTREIANRVLDRDLKCGLSFKLVNKVFERMGYELMKRPPLPFVTREACVPKTGAECFQFVASNYSRDYMWGKLYQYGFFVGDLTLILASSRSTLDSLKKLGFGISTKDAKDINA